MFYLIHKKTGISSFEAISKFRRENKIKKIGHSGTLDPLAEGLLLVATDEDTKLLEYISNKTKEYIVEGVFGYETDTYDILGKVINITDNKVTEEVLNKKLEELSETRSQVPPKFSAKKINGVRAYELARNDIDFEIKEQKIKIFDYKLLSFDFAKQTYRIYFKVSEGCYIRSLVNDLGLLCKNYSTMTKLERNGIGVLHISMLNGKEFAEINYKDILNLPTFIYNQKQREYLKNGNKLTNINNKNDEVVLLINGDTNEIGGVAKIFNNELIVKKIFPNKI